MTAKNIHQRLAAVMAEVTYIRKEKKTGMNYTIVSHDAVTAKVRPALLKHGIVYYPVRCDHHHNGNRAECSLTVRFVNVDDPADFLTFLPSDTASTGRTKGRAKPCPMRSNMRFSRLSAWRPATTRIRTAWITARSMLPEVLLMTPRRN
ncbi:ERF family protein [Paracoccus sp. DMF-8]|uniref:ERF family protein n=1 Tax=Paracoccus sp. DMF-8 TaxID=3019445 RepID=UPI0023E84A15|nr:ERF family protein [Paracoccus sp. DMF-8]MDF3606286.1 ERF family protein [Paracoccus sp. DMF-8]